MHEDLRDALHKVSRVAQDSDARPDLEYVQRGGRRLRWFRRIGVAGVVFLLVAGGSAFLSQLSDPSPRSTQEAAGTDETTTAQTPETSDGTVLSPDNVPSWRVVTFAVRAVAQAGLSDTSGVRLEYRDQRKSETGWELRFASAMCQDNQSCEQRGPVRFSVRTSGSVLEISEEGISGLDSEAAGSIVGHRELLTSEFTSLEFLAPTLTESPDEGIGVLTSELWTGSLPEADSEMSVTCHLEIYDHSGKVIHTGGQFEMLVPTDEGSRTDSGTHLFGAPADLAEAAAADVTCGEAHDVSDAPEGSRKTWGLPFDED